VASPALQSTQPPEHDNSFSRIFGVLFSPKATFESIARRPTWLVPVILLCIVELCIIGVFSRRVGWRGLIEKQMANSSQFQQLSPAQQQNQIEVALRYAPAFGYVEVILAPFLAALAFAAASKLLCRVLRRDLTALLRKARRVALRAALIADWVLAMVDVKFGAVQGLKRQSGSQRYCGPGGDPWRRS